MAKETGDRQGDSDQLTISSAQAIWVSLGFNVGTVFVIIAREVTEQAGPGSFLVVPAGFLIMLVPVLTIFLLNRRFPGKRFGQYSQTILGPFLGKGLAVAFAMVATLTTSVLLRRDSGLIAESLMPETPLWFFMTLQLILAYYALSRGFEVFARLCQVLFVAVAASLIFLFFAAFAFVDLENYMPIFAAGLGGMVRGGLPVVAFSAQYMMMAGVLVSHMRSPKKAVGVGLFGWLGAGLLLSMVVIAVQGIFGAEQTVKFVNPPLELAKIIQLGGLARGVEAILVGAWMVAGLFQGAGFYYLAAVTFSDAFKKPGYHIWLAILYLVILGVAMQIKNAEQLVFAGRIIRYGVILPLVVGSYLLLGVVAWIRGLFRGPAGSKEGDR